MFNLKSNSKSNIDGVSSLIPTDWTRVEESIIKVIGVGGGGCNAVNTMFLQGIKGVEFIVCNTDKQSLDNSPVNNKIYLGKLGAGCDPEVGRQAATESAEKIKKILDDNSEMVFITAGMGGGTGTGATPVIARLAKEAGKLTVGVVTIPFRDEGNAFLHRAITGLNELNKYVDCLLIIDNQKLYDVFENISFAEALPKANEVLNTAVKSIVEIVTKPGLINVDFADVKMVMKNGGMAIMGIGAAEGNDRASLAVDKAFESPLLNDCDLKTAKGVLVNISSGGNMAVNEVQQILEYVDSYTGTPDKFKRGVVVDPSLGEKISVTIVATGFEIKNLPQIHIEDDPDVIILDPENSPLQSYNIGSTNENSTTAAAKPDESKEIKVGREKWEYKKTPGTPSLIEKDREKIIQLEREPAINRRSRLIWEAEKNSGNAQS